MNLTKLIISLSLCIATYMANAQNFGAGYILALSSTQVAGDKLAGFNKAGIATGFFTSLKINAKFAAEMQILIIQKGSKTKVDAPYYYRLSLNYAELPLNIRYSINNKFDVYSGLAIAYLFKSKEEDAVKMEILNTPPIREYETSINIGATYNIEKKLYFDLRAFNSIIPIRKNKGMGYPYMNFDQYNTGLYFGLKYFFAKEK